MMNRLNLINVAFEQGYVSYLPVVDEGIDLILYREKPWDLKMVQLKGRWTINKKYINRDIWIAFPQGTTWYLAPHDMLIPMRPGALLTAAWIKGGEYSSGRLSKRLLAAMKRYVFPLQPN